ncbi:hypothetical protein N7533_002158 [Penicillium manginii]|jgi:hypothetical protein|uniref:uncharacterized protein n=1 Tax=Penicillium manginii TaxID=203109 RepID=UPI00254801A8|nr:uncharacterized protein N7533_002158 [Penicillium manginii]KAJ5763477.1 hypothetical protein N7533_002158 [Penicillium manginii]
MPRKTEERLSQTSVNGFPETDADDDPPSTETYLFVAENNTTTSAFATVADILEEAEEYDLELLSATSANADTYSRIPTGASKISIESMLQEVITW